MPSFLHYCWRSELRSSCSHRKHFTDWAILLIKIFPFRYFYYSLSSCLFISLEDLDRPKTSVGRAIACSSVCTVISHGNPTSSFSSARPMFRGQVWHSFLQTSKPDGSSFTVATALYLPTPLSYLLQTAGPYSSVSLHGLMSSSLRMEKVLAIFVAPMASMHCVCEVVEEYCENTSVPGVSEDILWFGVGVCSYCRLLVRGQVALWKNPRTPENKGPFHHMWASVVKQSPLSERERERKGEKEEEGEEGNLTPYQHSSCT